MARKRVSMREGPLAELFRATEAAQRQAEQAATRRAAAPQPAGPEPGAEPAPTEILSVVPDRPTSRRRPGAAAPSLAGRRSRPSPSQAAEPSSRSPAGSSRCPRTRRASSARATAPPTWP